VGSASGRLDSVVRLVTREKHLLTAAAEDPVEMARDVPAESADVRGRCVNEGGELPLNDSAGSLPGASNKPRRFMTGSI
jgi:hypothetical protein